MGVGNLNYFCFGEIFTCIFSLILIFNILMSFSFDDKRHRLFLYGSISSFLSAFFDIISVFCITYYNRFPIWLDVIVTTVFFLFLCIVPFVLYCYANSVAFSYSKVGKMISRANQIVYLIYAIIILLNVKTGWVFRYDSVLGYVRGPLKNITYGLALFYSVQTVICVVIRRKYMPRRIRLIFMVYPVVSLLFLSIQLMNNKIIMTGVASFAALFFAYITIQSDLMEYDVITGLMTESKLKKYVNERNSEGYIFVMSIENSNMLMQNMDSAEMNQLLFSIGKQISACFKNFSFHVTTNRFAGVCSSVEQIYNYSEHIEHFVNEINEDYESILPAPLDVYYVGIGFPKGKVAYESLTEVVNNMLVKAKKEGIQSLTVCDEEAMIAMERRRLVHKILKRELSLDSMQLQVWYQPIYSIEENKFTYMEALSRLNSTEIGNIPPAEFVDVAESRGLIEKLGNVVFEKVCKFISENRDVIPSVSVNFSVYQMVNPNLAENVLNTIRRFNISTKNVILEITESIFIEDFDIVCTNMKKLAASGIRFYLDDFGTGYSNLANVVMLPFSTVKIDRSLVLMTEENSKNIKFLTNIMNTFKDAGLKIICEGVETENQNEVVKNAGADFIQGFLFSRPIPEKECVELFRKQ